VKVLFEISVLVAALVASHPHHSRAFPWLRKANEGEIELLISSHAIAELYAVLSTLPDSPRVTPGLVWRLMHESVLSCATVTALSSSD